MSDLKKEKELVKKVRHDARNSLSVISGYLDYQARKGVLGDEKEYLEAAQASAKRLLNTVDELAILYQEDQKQAEAKSVHQPSQNHQRITVEKDLSDDKFVYLVVDDDDEIQVQWRQILKELGADVIPVYRGETLLQSNIEFSKIKGAIVDYEFENSSLNGFDVIEYLQRKNIRNIHLCTGMAKNEEIKRLAKEFSVSSVIGKPLPEDVAKILRVS